MHPVVVHIASGDAYFSGTVLMLTALGCSLSSRRIVRRLSVMLMMVGAVAVIMSATPIPWWLGGLTVAAIASWGSRLMYGRWQRPATTAAAVAFTVLILAEIPWHRSPPLQPVEDRSMTVIGDSVTAWVGGDHTAERWPQMLSRRHDLQVQDLSHVGETASSALRRLQTHEITGALIIVEIGGNDLLGRDPSSARFAEDLDALLSHLAQADRQIVMFELPLPPFHQEFGRVQRQAAIKHGVTLIPRRRFLSVLAAGEATVDSIHLSPSGHQRMADCVWRVIGPAFSRDESENR